ncbi:MAG: hypothetical protein M1819_007247 [Sarea resinae]|nr:MAG: hypothetical protein M1819_007247 [Sarea resinae]
MADVYNLVDYDSEEERERDPQGPPRANLFAAAIYLKTLWDANNIAFAALGGFAMMCRGSERQTRDIDLVVQTNMATLWALITPQPRLIIPNTRLLDGVIKRIEVDLMTPGFKGTPMQVSQNRDNLSVHISGQGLIFPCLSILYMMQTKLNACAERGAPRDFEDVQHLLVTYPGEIAGIRNRLNPIMVDGFLESIRVNFDLNQQSIADCHRVLGR